MSKHVDAKGHPKFLIVDNYNHTDLDRHTQIHHLQSNDETAKYSNRTIKHLHELSHMKQSQQPYCIPFLCFVASY